MERVRAVIHHCSRIAVTLAVAGLLVACSAPEPTPVATASRTSAAAEPRRMVVACGNSCASVAAAISSLGGEVRRHLSAVGAISAIVPADRARSVLTVAGVSKVYKDPVVRDPSAVRSSRIEGHTLPSDPEGITARELDEASLAALSQAAPNDFLISRTLTNAAPLHQQGIQGQGVVIAVIDSGTARVASLGARVIGGENLVPGASEPSALSSANNSHGTFVGTMIAGNGAFIIPKTHAWAQAIALYLPSSIIGCDKLPAGFCGALDPAAYSVLPIVGNAPQSQLYALKVFPAAGGGAPESRIIQAMERALTLRRNYNAGMPSVPVSGNGTSASPYVYDSLNIQIVNMSLGGPTGFAGRDMEDKLTQEMLREGITVVTSAGNDGMAAMTGGSPGTGVGSLTVGAASVSGFERVAMDIIYGAPGLGQFFRPTNHIQSAYFSSRGPTADGRNDPELTALGDWNLGQTATNGLTIGSGTSFSSPNVAGIAALLRQAVPGASATRIRNALAESANPNILGDDSRRIDQGRGLVDAAAALARLKSGRVSPFLAHGLGSPSVRANLLAIGQYPIQFRNNKFTARVRDLKPGEVSHFFVPADDSTSGLEFRFFNVEAELAPEEQNLLFGDDLHIAIANAPTSYGEWIVDPNGASYVPAGADVTVPVDNPQTGFVRLAVQGDWTNVGRISASVEIRRVQHPNGPPTESGRVRQGETDLAEFDVPASTKELVLELFWREDWSHYPTNDLDLIVLDPAGGVNYDGATIASPERVVIANPVAGTWLAAIDGYTVHTSSSRWKLRATADGRRIGVRCHGGHSWDD